MSVAKAHSQEPRLALAPIALPESTLNPPELPHAKTAEQDTTLPIPVLQLARPAPQVDSWLPLAAIPAMPARAVLLAIMVHLWVLLHA